MRIYVTLTGLVAVLGMANALHAVEGLTEEGLARVADTVFTRFDADSSGGLNSKEMGLATNALYGKIESIARRALGEARLKASDLMGEGVTPPALNDRGEVSSEAFHQHVVTMYKDADRQVRALYERRAAQFEALQREMRARDYERYSDIPSRPVPYGEFDRGRFPREGEGFGREMERPRGEEGRREEGVRGNEEQRRREAAAIQEQRRQMERAQEMQRRQMQEAQARARAQQQQQPRIAPPTNQRAPFGRPAQPGGATFKDRLQGKK